MDYIKCGLTAIPVGELDETLEQEYFTINPDTGLTVIDEEWQVIVFIKFRGIIFPSVTIKNNYLAH